VFKGFFIVLARRMENFPQEQRTTHFPGKSADSPITKNLANRTPDKSLTPKGVGFVCKGSSLSPVLIILSGTQSTPRPTTKAAVLLMADLA
jgi:hypothetical protein